ncbi:MAG TPA: PEGA domain-containing protein [Polyangia bacterium]
MNDHLDMKAQHPTLVRCMQMRPLVVRASYFVVVFLLLGLGQARAVEAPSEEAAMKHFARALELVDQSDFQGALQQFKDAYAAQPHFAVWYNIAQAHISLGQPPEAIEALLRYLREGQSQIPSGKRLQVEAQIKSLEAFLGELEVTTEPPGAVLTIDGREIGRTPLSEPIRLAAGTHKIAASLDGRPTVERTVSIVQGRHHEVVLQLPPQPPMVAPPRNISPGPVGLLAKPTPVRSSLRPALPYVLASAGVALGGAALGVYLWKRDKYEQWQNGNAQLRDLTPGSDSYARRATENNRLAASLTSANRAIVGLAIGGGVLTAAGVALYLFDRRSERRSAHFTVVWNGGPSVAAGWSGSW